ncbi:MAG: flap endonuclease [Deltaproteobacteria bacterium]|nr:MAG: flap endonuclease [Deltaproteobacteria bacterium]
MLLLIDYSSLLFRSFHTLPPSIPMHAVYGFLNMLARLVTDRGPQHLAIAVDEDWRPAFRVEALPSYKTHRLSDEPDPIGPQEALGREVLTALGVAVAGAEGFEAEDVIATLAARAREPVEIVSGDRDLFALVRDPKVRVLYPLTGVTKLLTVVAAEDLPPAVARRLAAAREYLAAARRVVPPVADVRLPPLDLALPATPAHPRRLAQLVATHDLDTPLKRVRAALAAPARRP